MDNVTPLTPGIMPEFDTEREMIQFVAEQINLYRTAYGSSPRSIAIALIGEDEGGAYTDANSWSPGDENRSRLQCCATAAAVLWKRALGL